MSDTRLDDHLIALPLPVRAPPATGERRRPGRMENVTPELIALMRKPDQAARMRVALYDAPGFLLPVQHRRPPMSGRTLGHMAIAFSACSGVCAVAFHTMLTLWG